MKEPQDNNKVCTAILTELSKAFVFLHDHLTTKLHAFGFDLKSLRLIHTYLNDRIQVTKVGSFLRVIHAYLNDRIPATKVGSFYSKTLQIIGPLKFNLNLTDIFLTEHYKSDFSPYADDTTPYNRRSTFLETESDQEITFDNLFNSYCYNNCKANT